MYILQLYTTPTPDNRMIYYFSFAHNNINIDRRLRVASSHTPLDTLRTIT